ncbi:hypothetical protein OVY01_08130 [Robbsia sp. Bb-Pol-6]|uniref:Uncharacterized protein n=1 Tax=Robbsia betulipollinis TaxID=2981849 RepID=A0ABT3ZKZ4_9BURK|nr:hypothetical protein [Robbsia betulipollinis]MCY0387199.1 hypothetical protein [Robbsia betulipollinis]
MIRPGKPDLLPDTHRERIGSFENARHGTGRLHAQADARIVRAIASARGTSLENVRAGNWITLLALLSHVGNLLAAPRSLGQCQAGAPFSVKRAPPGDGIDAVFNVTGIVERDFRQYCIATNQNAAGRERHACEIGHIARIKRATDSRTVYAIGRHRNEPVNVLSMRSVSHDASPPQHFSLYSRHPVARNTMSTYRMTLGVDLSRKGAADFMRLREKSPSGEWRSVLHVGRDGKNRLRLTRPGPTGRMVHAGLANLQDFGIRRSDYFTLLATVCWQGADSSIGIQLARKDDLVDRVKTTQAEAIQPAGTRTDAQRADLYVIRFGSDDAVQYRASFGLENVSGRLGSVNLHSLTEHHCSI